MSRHDSSVFLGNLSPPGTERTMGKLIVTEFVTIEGVTKAPGGLDEDRDGGFRTAAGRRQWQGQSHAAAPHRIVTFPSGSLHPTYETASVPTSGTIASRSRTDLVLTPRAGCYPRVGGLVTCPIVLRLPWRLSPHIRVPIGVIAHEWRCKREFRCVVIHSAVSRTRARRVGTPGPSSWST
jgi:hypothetical protein